MQINVEEISQLIKQKIEGFKLDFDKDETGIVISIGDGIAQIYGLENVMYNELVEFPNDIFGIALNLEEDNVGAIILGEGHLIKEGDIVRRTKRIISVPAGEALVGRVVNPLGEPLDDKGPIDTKVFMPMVISMIEVGEETGKLPEMLMKIADVYDNDVDNAVAGITSIIEPILIVLLAGIVGFIVIALFLPLITLIQTMETDE